MAAHITKLNDTNYPEWSIQMKAILVRKNLWEVTSGDDEKPAGSPNAKTVRAWQRRNDEAIAEIQLNVEPDQLSHVTGNEAHEIWTLLQEVHSATGLGSRIILRTEFYSQRMGPDLSIQGYVAQVRKTAFRLEQAGAEITDEERLGVLLAGLPPRFGPFIVSLEALPESDRSFTAVVRRLINEDTRLGPTTGTDAALAATAARTPGAYAGPKRPISEITCFNCGQKGHYRIGCPLPPAPTAYQRNVNGSANVATQHVL